MRLARRISSGAARQVDIRRAISVAYFAVFHMILTAAADLAMGRTRRGTPAYGLAYRSIDHKWLHTVCDVAQRISTPLRYRPYVPEFGFASDVWIFANNAIVLQEQRHTADYAPSRSSISRGPATRLITRELPPFIGLRLRKTSDAVF